MNSVLGKQLARRVFTVCVEGNIGSGKSTSLSYLANKYGNVTALSEPVDKWRDLDGHNLIELMYNDLSRHALAFESYAQLTRLQMYANSYRFDPKKPIRLMERSIYSQRFCFTENLIQSKNLTKPEEVIIDEWFRWLATKECFAVDLIVYLRTDPQTVFERIKNRSRDEEKEIPIEYLRELHELHDKWLLADNQINGSPKVITIDANVDQKLLFSALDQTFDKIVTELTI